MIPVDKPTVANAEIVSSNRSIVKPTVGLSSRSSVAGELITIGSSRFRKLSCLPPEDTNWPE